MGHESEELPRSSWESALESLSKEHDGDLVTIETPALDLGDQLEAERLPLAYLEYDRHDDAVSAAVGGRDGKYPVVLRHVIEHPSKVFVATMGSDGPWPWRSSPLMASRRSSHFTGGRRCRRRHWAATSPRAGHSRAWPGGVPVG